MERRLTGLYLINKVLPLKILHSEGDEDPPLPQTHFACIYPIHHFYFLSLLSPTFVADEHCVLVRCGVVWCDVVRCGVVWCDVVRCGVVWCGGAVGCSVVWCVMALSINISEVCYLSSQPLAHV